MGRYYLAYGSVMTCLVGASLAFATGSSFVTAFPVLLPIFGTVGSMGALTVFTSDRMKGTLEYFLAYGISPQRLFTNVMVASLVLVSVVVGIATTASLVIYLARGNPPSGALALGLGLYAFPMSYASAALATMVGTYWSALSSPRGVVSSPIGLAPLFGIAPSVAVLLIIAAVGVTTANLATSTVVEIAVSGMAVTAFAAIVLLASSGRLLRRERLLSSS